MKHFSVCLYAATVVGLMVPAHGSAHQEDKGLFPLSEARSDERIIREVRHELVMLPYYGVFDNLAYRVDGATVTLIGQVTRPILKFDAANVVKRIEGVDKVD